MSAAAEISRPASSGKFKLSEWIFTTDHKRVGVLYMIGSFTAFFVAGLMAMLMRTELATLGPTITDDPGNYNAWLTFHGAAMIVAFQIPALTGYFGNYYVPLLVGAKDVAFPRLNAFSVWLFWMGIIVALMTFMIPDPPDIMWTGYPPYSLITDGNTAFYTMILLLLGFSSITGGINLLTTIVRMRAPGVTWNKLNMYIWCLTGALVLQLVFVPFLGDAVIMLSLDKYLGFNFFNAEMGGSALLYENMFWSYSHPAVYVIFLPGIGIIFEIISVFSKNPIFNYKGAVYAGVIALVAISGEVWVHHLYTSGTAEWLVLIQTFTTLLISVPVGILMISLVGTLYKGSIEFTTPMLYAVGFIFLFLIGGLTGIPNAMSSIYIHVHGTQWITAHFHYVMAVSMTVAIIGGTYYIWPKMTGRMYSEKLGKVGFYLFFIAVNCTFFPWLYLGYKGMPRRYYDYEQFPDFQPLQQLITASSYMIFVAALVILFSWIHSLFKGEKAPDNPWGANSLDWTHTGTPPPPGNFGEDVVLSEDWDPYDYKDYRS